MVQANDALRSHPKPQGAPFSFVPKEWVAAFFLRLRSKDASLPALRVHHLSTSGARQVSRGKCIFRGL